MTIQADPTDTATAAERPAVEPISTGMKPVAVAFAIANGVVVALFVMLVALGHVETGLPGVDLGFTATAAPSGR